MENNDLKNSEVSTLLFSSHELSFPENENEKDRNMKNEKYLQKRKSKEEKMKMKHGRLKEKRSEYSARLKIRNTDAWNSMTEEQQKDQKINKKIQTQLCEDVSHG
jgi:ABC-type oligopeptide transport system ATPase subunit